MTNLQIEISIATIILLFLIIVNLSRNRLSVRHSIAWLLLPIAFILIALFPTPLETLSDWLGFETFSNFIFLIIIALLILVCFFITVSNSRQQSQIAKLNQELSILKAKVSSKNKPNSIPSSKQK